MNTLFFALLLHAATRFGHSFQAGHVQPKRVVAPSSWKNDVPSAHLNHHGARSPPSLGMSAEESNPLSENEYERRSFIQSVAQSIVLSSSVMSSSSSAAFAEDNNNSNLPQITHKVFMDVRISRADGTFYVRDESSDSTPADEPLYGQLVLGLFGNETPNHVQQFLKYVDVPYDVDSPLPSYSRSKFQMLDAATGLLIGGTIPGLDIKTLAGGNVLEYSGRVLPAKLWLEDKSKGAGTSQLSHNMKGLLTHRNLDLTPSFGVTTRTTSTSLDATHTIFGCILEDKSGFLEKVVDLPVLTDEGKVSRTTDSVSVGDVGGSLASAVFTTQRKVFRDAAKTFGDSRLEKVYDGKLLRRIEVTKVGVL